MTNKIRLQPLVSLADGSVCGYEVLYKKGLLSRFPSAVSILKAVFKHCKFQDKLQWHINMTPRDAANPSFAKNFVNAMRDMNISTDKIVLEVSENTGPKVIHEVKKNLDIIHAEGVRIALDDFGTRYSPLSFMSELPIDIVKIDQGLAQMASIRKKERSLMKFVVQMSHELGCKVVVEGIENNAILECVMKTGADIGQGFLFSAAEETPSPFINLCEFLTGMVKPLTKVAYCS